MKKIVILNGSPRNDEISNTYKALQSELLYFKEKFPNLKSTYIKIPSNLQGCIHCSKCTEGCVFNDEMKEIIKEISDADTVLLGSPVYLDMPTPQTVAFLTRLNCMAENTDRKFFEGKDIYLVATSYCSGTKTCIHTMLGACEMLGFNIPGRSTREYISLWKDEKLRGGMSKKDSIFLIE